MAVTSPWYRLRALADLLNIAAGQAALDVLGSKLKAGELTTRVRRSIGKRGTVASIIW